MEAIRRSFVVSCAAAVLLALTGGTSFAAARTPAPHAKPCRPARSARCLRKARGPEAVIVSPRGTMSRADALQAFAQTVGPLPGVKPEPGAVDRRMFESLSGPFRWAAAYLKTMTRAQRAAFAKLLNGSGRGRRAHAAANPSPAQVQKWTQAANTAATLLGQHLGVSLFSAPALPLDVTLLTTPDPDSAAAEAAATPVDKNGNWATGLGPGVSCRIQVFPIGWQSSNPDVPIIAVSHEVAHCFQFKLASTAYGTLSASPWLLEGGAEWAGDQVAQEALGHEPHDSGLTNYWNAYLKYPSIGLFTRVYDAVGFFAHLAETAAAGTMWPKLREMFKALGNPAQAYGLAVPDGNLDFLDSWASGYARTPSLGAGWDTTGIGITPAKPPIPLFGGTGNTVASLDAGPRSNALARVNIADQVLAVTSFGGPSFGRLRDANGTTYSLDSSAYCVSGQDCTCPAGTDGFGEQLPTIAPGVAWVALSGNNSATHVTLTRMNASAWCRHPIDYSPPVGTSNITIGGGATGTSYAGGRNDSCTLHQSNPLPPDLYFQCFFEIAEPGSSAIAQLTLATFRYTGPGQYDADTRGTTVWPEVGFTDLANTFDSAQLPQDVNAGGFTITGVSGNMISGTINASMEDVTQPDAANNVAGASGSFTVPLQIAP